MRAPVKTMDAPVKAEKGHKYSITDLPEHYLPLWAIILVYWAYTTMLVTGYFNEWAEKILVFLGIRKSPFSVPKGYASILKEIEYFWLRRMYGKLRDLFERPIASVPGAEIDVLNRASDDDNASFYFTGGTTRCVNMGSYNYLGFAENSGPVIDTVLSSIDKYSVATASPVMESGRYDIVEELEKKIASYVGKPEAMVFGMGYATNSTTLPALAGRGSLLISDTLNHASIVNGCRDSGAKILVFKHNDPEDLEKVLRNAIIEGQPRTHRPWSKIIIIAEGIYSMEGEICRLPEIVALKKKYKAYLYVDEAHSIGALGKRGRGVCEQTGVNPDDVDILMGTFTKAFGSVGGYIAGSHEIVSYLRHCSYASVYAASMSAPCAQQALSALRVISGEDGGDDGRRRIQKLKDNSNYFRESMLKEGFHIVGDADSPVIITLVYHPAMMGALSRELLKQGVALVVVGFPVTPLMLSRLRFCVSASHTQEQLDKVVQLLSELAGKLYIKFGNPVTRKPSAPSKLRKTLLSYNWGK